MLICSFLEEFCNYYHEAIIISINYTFLNNDYHARPSWPTFYRMASLHPSSHPSIHPSFVDPPNCPHTDQHFRPSTDPSISLSICLSIYIIDLSAHLNRSCHQKLTYSRPIVIKVRHLCRKKCYQDNLPLLSNLHRSPPAQETSQRPLRKQRFSLS
jgi:hypothetical protein